MRRWLRDTADRASSTFAQVFLAVSGLDALGAMRGGLWAATKAGAVAALLSVLQAVAMRRPDTTITAGRHARD